VLRFKIVTKKISKTRQYKLESKLKHYTQTLGFLPDASTPFLRFMPPPVPGHQKLRL
jgi:hypothetical protein